jgi:membrane-bound metal-dependent hydrolase YbcI (DUF457 family)
MDWKGHIVIGAICSVLFFYFMFSIYDNALLIQLLFISTIAALAPDLDHDSSMGKKLADVVIVIFAALIAYVTQSFLYFFAVVGVYFILFKILQPKHRGITHTLFACVALSAILIIVTANGLFGLAFAVGYFSHLLADGEVRAI